jgi:hypothetical protein
MRQDFLGDKDWNNLSAEDKLKATSLNLFNEDTSQALDENGRIIRKDMFKGFTAAQKKRFFQENEALLYQRR